MVNIRPWPFREPRNRGVFTTRQVLAGIYPVLCIVQDSGTGGWRFLDLKKTEPEDLVGITLEEVIEVLDTDVLEAAIELTLSARATRASVNDPWIHDYWDGRTPSKATILGRSGKPRAKRVPSSAPGKGFWTE